MLLTKLKTATVVLVGSALLGGAVGTPANRAQGQAADGHAAKPPTTSGPANEKEPRPTGSGTLLVFRVDSLRNTSVATLTPEGKKVAVLSAPDETGVAMAGHRLSPDGLRVALLVMRKQPRGPLRPPPRVGAPDDREPPPYQLIIRKVSADKPVVTIDLPCEEVSVSWSPDGKQLVAAKLVNYKSDAPFENVLIHAQTGQFVPLGLPAGTRVLDWSQDGRTFLVEAYDRKVKMHRLGLAVRGDKEVIPLCDLRRHPLHHPPEGRFSPDGKQVLFIDADPENEPDAHRWSMSARPYLLDVASKKRLPLADFPLNGQAIGITWSPDGRRVAYTWKRHDHDLFKKKEILAKDASIQTEGFLMVTDADGKNAHTVDSAKGPRFLSPILGTVDWR